MEKSMSGIGAKDLSFLKDVFIPKEAKPPTK
jgi:hypothetical protein